MATRKRAAQPESPAPSPLQESYDYGPPVEVEGETSTPANHEGVDIENEGATPHTPPENTATVTVAGGSPSVESGVTPEAEPDAEPEPEPDTSDE